MVSVCRAIAWVGGESGLSRLLGAVSAMAALATRRFAMVLWFGELGAGVMLGEDDWEVWIVGGEAWLL